MRLFRAMQSVTERIQSCHRGLSALYQYLTQCPPEHSDLLTLCLWDLPTVLITGVFPEVRIAGSGFAVKHCIIDYINVLNSSQAGLKWRHSDFFPFSSLCLLSL